jgi:hypothetical protein
MCILDYVLGKKLCQRKPSDSYRGIFLPAYYRSNEFRYSFPTSFIKKILTLEFM